MLGMPPRPEGWLVSSDWSAGGRCRGRRRTHTHARTHTSLSARECGGGSLGTRHTDGRQAGREGGLGGRVGWEGWVGWRVGWAWSLHARVVGGGTKAPCSPRTSCSPHWRSSACPSSCSPSPRTGSPSQPCRATTRERERGDKGVTTRARRLVDGGHIPTCTHSKARTEGDTWHQGPGELGSQTQPAALQSFWLVRLQSWRQGCA